MDVWGGIVPVAQQGCANKITALASGSSFPAAPGLPNITVVHLITGLNTGGAEMMLAKLVGSMDRRRFRSVVVSMIEPGPISERIEASGIPVFSLGLTRDAPDPIAIINLFRILRRERPHIVQTWLHHAGLLGRSRLDLPVRRTSSGTCVART